MATGDPVSTAPLHITPDVNRAELQGLRNWYQAEIVEMENRLREMDEYSGAAEAMRERIANSRQMAAALDNIIARMAERGAA